MGMRWRSYITGEAARMAERIRQKLHHNRNARETEQQQTSAKEGGGTERNTHVYVHRCGIFVTVACDSCKITREKKTEGDRDAARRRGRQRPTKKKKKKCGRYNSVNLWRKPQYSTTKTTATKQCHNSHSKATAEQQTCHTKHGERRQTANRRLIHRHQRT